MLNLGNLCWKDGHFSGTWNPPQGIFKGNPNWQGLQTIPWPAWNFPPGAECWVFPPRSWRSTVECQRWKQLKDLQTNWSQLKSPDRGRELIRNCNWHCLKIKVFRWGKSVLAIIHPRKITCQWKYNRLKMYLLFEMMIFQQSSREFFT